MHKVKLRLQELKWPKITQLVRKKAGTVIPDFLMLAWLSIPSWPPSKSSTQRLSVVWLMGLGLMLASNARDEMTSHKGHLSSSCSLGLPFFLLPGNIPEVHPDSVLEVLPGITLKFCSENPSRFHSESLCQGSVLKVHPASVLVLSIATGRPH